MPTAPFFIMPGGIFPMQNGKPVLVTQADYDACCCDPCNNCTPALHKTYTVTVLWDGGSMGPHVLTSTGTGTCIWEYTSSGYNLRLSWNGAVGYSRWEGRIITMGPESLYYSPSDPASNCTMPASLLYHPTGVSGYWVIA